MGGSLLQITKNGMQPLPGGYYMPTNNKKAQLSVQFPTVNLQGLYLCENNKYIDTDFASKTYGSIYSWNVLTHTWSHNISNKTTVDMD